jgi:mRNA interferase MazF
LNHIHSLPSKFELKASAMKTIVHAAPITAEEDDKPPRVPPRLKAAPSIRQLFWCDFPLDAHLPEFWKCRPVVIVSFKNTLSGAVTVVPCSSQPQDDNPWAFRLRTTINAEPSWAICDKLTTVAVSRLSPHKLVVPRLPAGEFHEMLALVLKWLPVIPVA